MSIYFLTPQTQEPIEKSLRQEYLSRKSTGANYPVNRFFTSLLCYYIIVNDSPEA